MKAALHAITYTVHIEDGTPIDAMSTGLLRIRVRPVKMIVFTNEQGSPWRIEALGPKVKSDGSVGAAYFTGLVSIDGERCPALPAEYREVVAQVTGHPL